MFTDISEKRTASIFKAEEWKLIMNALNIQIEYNIHG
jgi:hypothetical protein